MLYALKSGVANVVQLTDILQQDWERDLDSEGSLSDDHEDDLETYLDKEPDNLGFVTDDLY